MPPVGAPRPVVSAGGAGGYVPSYQMSPIPPEGSRRRGLKVFGIVVGSIAGLLALVYFAGVVVFMGRFFPHTSIIDMDISGKTPEEVHQMLSDVLADYTFKVEGQGLNLTLSAADLGMSLDSQAIADNLLSQMNPWAWPYEIFQSHDDTEDLVSTFEETKLADTVQTAVAEANAKGQAPKNATVAYDSEAKEYVVVPEVPGDTLLPEVVLDQVVAGTVNFAPKVVLTDEVLAQPTVTKDDPSLAAARDEANGYVKRTIQLMMAGQEALTIDEDALASHITIGDDLAVSFDPEPLVAWVKDTVNGLDTVGRHPHLHAARRQGGHGGRRRLRLDYQQPGHSRQGARGSDGRRQRPCRHRDEMVGRPAARRERPRFRRPLCRCGHQRAACAPLRR